MTPLSPTPLPEVNAVLTDLVQRWREILGPNLVGAYLQGSFAVGDFNERSDIDFIVVVGADLTAPELALLQTLHAEMQRQPSYWAKHLEGSYVPAAILRRLTDEPREPIGEPVRPAAWRDPGTGMPPKHYPLLHLGNGTDTLVRSEHDNTLVVRWVLRERGIALCGPAPATLIDPITADELRAEVRTNLLTYTTPYLTGELPIDAVWLQAFFVTLICRMLQTLVTGEIHSKAAGTAWALRTLPPQWHDLAERAAATWAGPQDTWHHSPDSAEVARTLAFMAFAVKRCGALKRVRPRSG